MTEPGLRKRFSRFASAPVFPVQTSTRVEEAPEVPEDKTVDSPSGGGEGATSPEGDIATGGGFPRYLLWVAIGFWLLASVAGAVSAALPTLPEEASISRQGEIVDTCDVIAPTLVAADPSIAGNWCTATEDLGRRLPDDVQFTSTGAIAWEAVNKGQVIAAATQPDVWFTLAIGAIAMLFLVGFSRATNTVRAGLAASISVVFFGLLLFPVNFTQRIPTDMRSELIHAWQLVLIFYFGTEGAVQAIKVLRPEGGASVGGDLAAGTPVSIRRKGQ